MLVGLVVGVSYAAPNRQPDDLLRINLVRWEGPDRQELIFNQQFSTVEGTDHLNRMNIVRFDGLTYIGEIRVGTPGKLFRVLFDSGSGDLWLPTIDCRGIDKTIINTYNQRQSSSFVDDGRPVKLSYANGVAISGYLAREFVQFGNLAIQNQTFIQIDAHPNAQQLQHYHVDGILGLNFKSGSGFQDVEAPLDKMMRAVGQNSKGKAKSMLSFSLNHGEDPNRAGQMIIGGLDESLYTGEIAWVPLMRSGEWKFRLDSIELNYPDTDEGYWETSNVDLNVCPHGCDALVDTGTTVILGPPKDIVRLNEKIGAFHVGGGRFALPSCEGLDAKLPSLSVSISGKRFSLAPSQYTFLMDGNCISPFRIINAVLPHWTLGNMFIGHFYAILDFDKQQFGLAESTFKTGKNIVNH